MDDFDMNEPVQYLFIPREDITAFELATIWSLLRLNVDDETYASFSPEIKRHFEPPEWHPQIDQEYLDAIHDRKVK